MSKAVWTLALILASSFIASAQDAAKKDAPKQALSASQAVLETWNDVGRKLTTMAEDFPENKYDFKPTPAQRSFAEQLLHAAGANYFFINLAKGEKPPAEEDPKRSNFKSKAEVAAFVKKSIADGAAVIQSKGDAGMSDLVLDPFSNQHDPDPVSASVPGQLAVYYRVAGLVPPASRPKK